MKKILFIIVLIIFVSGCLNQIGTSNQGIEIKTFEFVPNKISSGQKTLLSLELINKGAISIDNKDRKAYVSIYGIGTEWGIDKDKISGVTENELTNWEDKGIIGPFELAASDPQYDLPAGEKSITFIVDSPKTLPKDQTFTYDFQARVCYDYYTEAIGKIELVSEEEWLAKHGEIKQHQIKMVQTSGPLNIKIDSMQPIIISEDSSLKIKLELENVGGGWIAEPDYDCVDREENDEKLNHAKINGEYTNIYEKSNTCYLRSLDDCSTETDGTVFFSKGKTGKFVCTLSCDKIDFERIQDLRIRFDYKYYKDGEARIDVKGV
jgi:hypothetical protein